VKAGAIITLFDTDRETGPEIQKEDDMNRDMRRLLWLP
jgi:hypothetical protein